MLARLRKTAMAASIFAASVTWADDRTILVEEFGATW